MHQLTASKYRKIIMHGVNCWGRIDRSDDMKSSAHSLNSNYKLSELGGLELSPRKVNVRVESRSPAQLPCDP